MNNHLKVFPDLCKFKAIIDMQGFGLEYIPDEFGLQGSLLDGIVFFFNYAPSSTYSGNLPKVLLYPTLDGFPGLNGFV